MQLPFAVIPLVQFVSDRRRWATSPFRAPCGARLGGRGGDPRVNFKLLYDTMFGVG